jgi:hypothetical protein
MCDGCLVTCSSGLGKRGWQHMSTAFLVVLLRFELIMIFRVKA